MNNRKVLLTAAELERSEVVANACMNRDRSAVGVNSYARELRFSPIDYLQQQCMRTGSAAWLDLCCGTGKALFETATAEQFVGRLFKQ